MEQTQRRGGIGRWLWWSAGGVLLLAVCFSGLLLTGKRAWRTYHSPLHPKTGLTLAVAYPADWQADPYAFQPRSGELFVMIKPAPPTDWWPRWLAFLPRRRPPAVPQNGILVSLAQKRVEDWELPPALQPPKIRAQQRPKPNLAASSTYPHPLGTAVDTTRIYGGSSYTTSQMRRIEIYSPPIQPHVYRIVSLQYDATGEQMPGLAADADTILRRLRVVKPDP